jgi:hypothetical protein
MSSFATSIGGTYRPSTTDAYLAPVRRGRFAPAAGDDEGTAGDGAPGSQTPRPFSGAHAPAASDPTGTAGSRLDLFA